MTAINLAEEFNKRFTSMNGIDVPERVSVPRDEWRALHTAIKQALAVPVQDIEHCLWARNGNTPCPHTTPPAAAPVQDEVWKAQQKAISQEALKCATEAMSDPNNQAAKAVREYYGAAQRQWVGLTDEDCTRIYNEANGITTKNPPITTQRIFAAMRAAHGITEKGQL